MDLGFTNVVTGFSAALLLSSLLIAFVLVRAFWHRDVPGARPLALLALTLFIWIVAYLFEIMLSGLESDRIWFNVRQMAVVFFPLAWYALAWEYFHQRRWDDFRRMTLLMVIPVVSIVLLWSSDLHSLLRTGILSIQVEWADLVEVQHGWWFGVETIYGLGLMFSVGRLFVLSVRRTPRAARSQAMILLGAYLIVVVSFVLTGLDLNPIRPLGLITLSFAPCLMLFSWALFRHQLFDLQPILRDRLFETMADGALSVDERGRIIDFNPAFAHFYASLKAPHSERLEGAPISRAVAAFPAWRAAYDSIEPQQIEIEAETTFGRCIYEVRVSPLARGVGPPQGFLTLVRDITQQKVVESALRDSETRHRVLAENASDLIFTCDGACRLTYISPSVQMLLGYEPNTLIGESINRLLNPEAYARIEHEIRGQDRARSTGAQLVNDVEFLTYSGESVWMEVNLSLMRAPVGSVLGVGRDIGPRREAQQREVELAVERERLRILEQFIRDASHDLRTPLTVFNTSTYLMRRAGEDVANQIEAVRDSLPLNAENSLLSLSSAMERMRTRSFMADQSASRVLKMLESMFEVIQIGQNPKIVIESYDLNQLVLYLASRNQKDAERAQIFFTAWTEESVGLVPLDPSRMGQALQKLIDNALTYTPPGGRLEIETYLAAPDDSAIIRVSNTGDGIPQDDLPHIFDYFYRVDRARSSHTGGAGLGLSVVRRIVEAHGGKIEVESTPDSGTTFLIRLPKQHAPVSDENNVHLVARPAE